MRLAIDCRALRKAPSGIPNFLVMAINQIALTYPDWEIKLLSNENFHEDYKKTLLVSDNIEIIISPFFIFKNVSFIWLLLKAGTVIKRIKPDIFWAPAFLLPIFLPPNIKTLVTVHDVVAKEFSDTMSFAGKMYARLLQDASINKADKLWTNSAYTAEAIEKHYPNRKNKQIFTGFFINTGIFRSIQISENRKKDLQQKYNLTESFFIFVGTLEPRKNLIFLMSLLPHLKHLKHKLIVVGAKGWGQTNIQNILSQKDYPIDYIEFPGFVETDDLVHLYNMATLYISTSLNEGFGMPQLEAMACGCPVVSPHNSAMIEVVEGAGETVTTWEFTDWVKTIEKVSNNRNYYVQKGYKRVEQYEASTVIKNLFQDFV